MLPETFFCKSHPDFHIPPDVDVGEGFDGDAYVRRLKQCCADAVVFFAKCHYGHAYYDTKVGTRHPRLRKDMLAEVVRGCRLHGLGAIAYFSVFLDSAAVRQNPDWGLKAQRDGTGAGFDSGRFAAVCVNSPYVQELLIPQTREVAAGYDVQEVFFDTMTGFHPCYCRHCRDRFGRDIPAGPQDADGLEYVRWYAAAYERCFTDVARAAHEARPGLAVTFNWEWGTRRPTPPPAGIDRLAADLIPSGVVACTQCRYFAGTGLPFDYMTGRFLHGLGDWNSNTPETLGLTAATTVANGGGFYLIDRQLPDGTLEERAYDAMRDVFGWLQQRREYLVGARHVPQIGLLHAYSHVMGPHLEYFPDEPMRQQRMKSFQGAVRLFMEHGRHFTALSADGLLQRAGHFPLLVVGEQEHLPPEVRRALAEYLDAGGRLLMTQSDDPAAVDEQMLELAGVQYLGHDPLDYGYFDLDPPLLTRGAFANVKPTGDSSVLVHRGRTMAAGNEGRSFGHGFAPPTGRDDRPAVIAARRGRGEVVYVAAPVLRSYLDYQSPQLARMLLGLVDRLLPNPVVRIATGAQVEMTAMRRDGDLLVHLVNHSGKERLGDYWYPVTEYIPEIRDIQVAIRSDRPRTVLRVPQRQEVSCDLCEGYLRFQSPALHILESFLVPDYFADRAGPATD